MAESKGNIWAEGPVIHATAWFLGRGINVVSERATLDDPFLSFSGNQDGSDRPCAGAPLWLGHLTGLHYQTLMPVENELMPPPPRMQNIEDTLKPKAEGEKTGAAGEEVKTAGGEGEGAGEKGEAVGGDGEAAGEKGEAAGGEGEGLGEKGEAAGEKTGAAIEEVDAAGEKGGVARAEIEAAEEEGAIETDQALDVPLRSSGMWPNK